VKTPYPFQEEAIEAALKAKGFIIGDECGLGKTLDGVEIIRRSSRSNNPLPNLIVCPIPVRFQWLFALMDQVPDMPHDMLATREDFEPEEVAHRRITIITHYEAMVRHAASLAKVYWENILVDEAHRIRNRQADRTNAVKRIQARRKIALTGTPMETSPADLWSILNYIRPDKYKGYWAFHEKYAMVEAGFGGHVRTVKGCKDPAALAQELAPVMIARTRRQVAPQLPSVITTPINLIMHPAQQKLYKSIDEATDVLVALPDTDETLFVRNAMTKVLKLQQVTSNPRLLEFAYTDVPSVKEDWVVEWCKDHPEDSVIIFAQFRQTVHNVASRIPGIAKLLGGGAGGQGKIPDFKKVHQIVATIAAAGEGIDLPHIKTAIFLDASWSFTKMKQATDRIQRLGIEEPRQIYFLSCVDTIDHKIIRAVEEKWTQHDLAVHMLNEYRRKQAA
jgi:SNF2 family DNA or RNA helicase